ncbi:MAG TPA: MFS transporter, partial [Bryobacteraceae bacterium]|nr:MFS transporter [Bryobacteraceae bacterium]
METPAKVNISKVIDNSRLGAFHWGVFLLCGLCLIMDGFDVQAIGYVAPALVRDWKIPSNTMGPVFSAALVGVLFGSILFSMLADRIGRRPVLIGVTLYFSVLTFLTARAGSVPELITLRFLGGLGLGAIMPNAMALVGEYSPAKSRVAAMMVVSNGFTLGAAFGGPIAAYLIPRYGWRSVFYFGAATPLLVAVLMAFLLPESLQYLGLRGRDKKQIARWLKHVDPAVEAGPDTDYIVSEEKKKGVPMIQLFHDGRALGTVLFWILNFMNLMNLYFLSNWLPTVIRDAGYSNTIAVNSGAVLQLGGVVGTLVLGLFVRRFGFSTVLSLSFALACASIAAIGQPYISLAILFAFIFIAGFGVPGSQAGLNAFAAVYYPTDLRATGVGAGLGIGRIGAIVGPLIAGVLLQRHWAAREVFLAAAVPALISVIV